MIENAYDSLPSSKVELDATARKWPSLLKASAEIELGHLEYCAYKIRTGKRMSTLATPKKDISPRLLHLMT